MAKLNGEKTKVGPVVLEKEGETVTGKRAANLFIKQYADISDIEIDKDRRRQVSLDIQELKKLSHGQKDIEMDRLFTHEELEQAIKTLKMKKSPGPDQVTNEMIANLGHGMKRKLLQLFNTSWKTGRVPQAWKVAYMTPIYKQGKNKGKAESYRPISLLSCFCKTMERMVNTRLTWHLENKNILIGKEGAQKIRPHSSLKALKMASKRRRTQWQFGLIWRRRLIESGKRDCHTSYKSME